LTTKILHKGVTQLLKGKTIRTVRTHLDLSLEELSKQTGYSLGYLSRIETSVVSMTKPVQEKILNVFEQHGIDDKKLMTIVEVFNNITVKGGE
jgi:transcriptional regulator with XRE-family HTH domain